MAGGNSRDGWHPRQGAVPVMQRLEGDAGGPHAFEVRATDGRELGVHATGDAAVEAAWGDHLAQLADDEDE